MSAVISDDGLYRYWLHRQWDGQQLPLCVVMLNPSTADHKQDDPTIRRCKSFAAREGFGGLVVVNLYALRATIPTYLWESDDPVGPENDRYLRAQFEVHAAEGIPVLAAWGANARPDRVEQVKRMMVGTDVRCLGTTQAGHPRHPLYVKGDQPMVPWLT